MGFCEQIPVAQIEHQKIRLMHENITFRWHMAQAKTLTKKELKRVVDVTNSCSRYAARDVTMLLLTHLCGLRIGEVANLRIADVRDTDGTIQLFSILKPALFMRCNTLLQCLFNS